MHDFRDEIPGYMNNLSICQSLQDLDLKAGVENISLNMIVCYEKLIEIGCVGLEEMALLKAWLHDVEKY